MGSTLLDATNNNVYDASNASNRRPSETTANTGDGSNGSNNRSTNTGTNAGTNPKTTNQDEHVNNECQSIRLVCTLVLQAWFLAACFCFVIVGTAIVIFSLGVLLYFIVVKSEWTWEEYARWQRRRLRVQVKDEFLKKRLKEIAEAA